MKRAIILAAGLCAAAVHAQVFKCQEGGKTIYSDRPCGQSAHALSERRLHGNSVGAIRVEPAAAPQLAAEPEVGQAIHETVSVRPTPQYLQELETAASATTLRGPEKSFLAQEVQRTKHAIAGEGVYTAQDWIDLKDDYRYQSRIDPRDRAKARAHAEAIHARASARARAEIAAQREREAGARKARRDAAVAETQRRAQEAARQQPTIENDNLSGCSLGTCRGQSGTSYTPAPAQPGVYTRADGKRCRLVAPGLNRLECF